MTRLAFDPASFGLLHKHPAPVTVGTQLALAPGQSAAFVQWGRVAGVLGAGEHTLDPAALPFLSILIQQGPSGAALGGELYVLQDAELPVELALPDKRDDATGVSAAPVLAIAVSVRVADPTAMLGQLAGPSEPGVLERFIGDTLKASLGVLAEKSLRELCDPNLAKVAADAALAGAREKLRPMAIDVAGVASVTARVPDDVRARLGVSAAPAPAPVAAPAAPAPVTAATAPVPVAAPAPPVAAAAAPAPAPAAPGLAAGSRIRISHQGAWYSGSIAQIADDKAEIVWDVSAQKTWLPLVGLEAEPSYPGSHPAGTRVLAQAADGVFRPATVRLFNGTSYEVAFDSGTSAWLSPGQLRLAPAG